MREHTAYPTLLRTLAPLKIVSEVDNSRCGACTAALRNHTILNVRTPLDVGSTFGVRCLHITHLHNHLLHSCGEELKINILSIQFCLQSSINAGVHGIAVASACLEFGGVFDFNLFIDDFLQISGKHSNCFTCWDTCRCKRWFLASWLWL